MKVLDILKDAAQRATVDINQTLTSNESAKTHYLRAFNLVYKYFNSRYNWPWREKTISLQTVPNYVTGTVTVTNGSRTVIGSGLTVFTSAMKDRYFRLNSDTELYQIKSVTNTNQFVLTDPYIGSSASAQGYIIWKKFYDLPPDVPMASGAYLWKWPLRVQPIPFKAMSNQFSQAYLSGFPSAWCWYGVNKAVSTYSATVIVTKDSKTLTASTAALLGNVFEGSRIAIGTNTYNVDTVDSDTQVTMVQNALTTSPTNGDSATFQTLNRSQICFNSVPSPAVNLFFTYPCRVYDLINDNDEPLIWEGYELALSNLLYAYILEKLTSGKSIPWVQIADATVREVYKDVLEHSPIETAQMPSSGFPTNYRPGLYS